MREPAISFIAKLEFEYRQLVSESMLQTPHFASLMSLYFNENKMQYTFQVFRVD